jgi:hypothetical protein
MVCADCHAMLAFARRPRAPRRVLATVPAVAVGPANLRVPFGPRAGEPVSVTRLALAEAAWGPLTQVCLSLIVVAAALLVVLAAHGI